ncbi:MAG: hypothetical protein DME24_23225 [Verrucomicrobia bacterium]|nr:MAG: hypothetical protein DME24_23225 [Verrucomicrobiota bacterium]
MNLVRCFALVLLREFPGYGGQQSLRADDWKLVRQHLHPVNKNASPQGSRGLYNLARDPGETRDVSMQHPEIVARLDKLLREQHTPSKDFPIRALDGD